MHAERCVDTRMGSFGQPGLVAVMRVLRSIFTAWAYDLSRGKAGEARWSERTGIVAVVAFRGRTK